MEISSLVMQGKFDQAERFYHYLLMPGSNGDENAMSSVDEDAEAPLWYAFKEMEHNEHPNQAAILHLFTGQMALVNVVALFADIGFYDQRRALYSLCDGIVNHVVDFATQLELSESVTDVITGCLFRMVQTISKLSVLFVEELPDGHIHSDCFAVLDTLIKFFVNPSNFLTVSGKVDMYGAIFQMLHTIRRLQSIVAQSIQDVDGANPNLTAIEMRTRLDNSAPLQKLIEQSGTYLVQCFNSDIASSVSSLKLIAVSCITELIHDDCDATENVIECLIRNGCIRFLLESLCTPDMMKPAQTEYVDKVVMYINSVLALFSRIAITPPGMQALTELGALSRLEKFPFWQQPSSDMLRKLLSPPDVAKPVLPSA
uniref:tRNA exportin n=1 Tax=Steinernema glaseri TaxID=37863 RepID=A0A1I8A0X3_9BILA